MAKRALGSIGIEVIARPGDRCVACERSFWANEQDLRQHVRDEIYLLGRVKGNDEIGERPSQIARPWVTSPHTHDKVGSQVVLSEAAARFVDEETHGPIGHCVMSHNFYRRVKIEAESFCKGPGRLATCFSESRAARIVELPERGAEFYAHIQWCSTRHDGFCSSAAT
jgi:hypothetical protein